ncbi:hypothetical protein BDAP_002000 [Binucleata daphniae]
MNSKDTLLYSNTNCAFLSLIPAVSSLVYMYVFDQNSFTYFKYLSSLSAIVILAFPFIIRNYTRLPVEFDHKVCAISCGIVIYKFIHACFTKNYVLNFDSSYVPILLTMAFDVLLLLNKNKKCVFIYKLLSCIGLAVLHINNISSILSSKNVVDVSMYAAMTIPCLLIIYLSDKKNCLSGSMCMLTFYTMLIHAKFYFASLKSENNVASRLMSFAEKYVFW